MFSTSNIYTQPSTAGLLGFLDLLRVAPGEKFSTSKETKSAVHAWLHGQSGILSPVNQDISEAMGDMNWTYRLCVLC